MEEVTKTWELGKMLGLFVQMRSMLFGPWLKIERIKKVRRSKVQEVERGAGRKERLKSNFGVLFLGVASKWCPSLVEEFLFGFVVFFLEFLFS